MQHISFQVDGQKLIGTIQYPEQVKEKNPAILMIHGWMSNQRRNVLYAKELNALGFIVMTFDLRSHGESEGDRSQLTREDYLNDVMAAYDLLVSQSDVNPEEIGIVGSSFGAYLGAILTAKRAVQWLVLRVPANYLDEGWDQPQVKSSNSKTTKWRSERLDPDATFSLRAIQTYPNYILIVESELDELCPHQTMENYMNAVSDKSKLTHKIIKGADHSLKSEKLKAVFTQILIDWFKNRI